MIRFAFKGRVSTEDQQDPEASRAWQLTRARTLIEPHGGVIVAEYFDSGHCRAIPWQRRPQALALLGELKNPDRAFDAVVIGGGLPEAGELSEADHRGGGVKAGP